MKNLIVAGSLLMVFATSAFAQNLKIMTVDVAYVLENYFEAERANAQLQQRAEREQEAIQAIQAEGQALLEELQTLREDVENEALSETARTEAETRAQELLVQIQQKQQQFQQEQVEARNRMQRMSLGQREVLLTKIEAAVAVVAEAEGADLVLDASPTTNAAVAGVIYGSDTISISEKVLAELNANAPESEE